MDFTVGLGNPDPNLVDIFCFARMHMIRSAVVQKDEALGNDTTTRNESSI